MRREKGKGNREGYNNTLGIADLELVQDILIRADAPEVQVPQGV